jgi:hypothetical protein
MKKILSSILVVSLLNLFGCYTTELVKPDEYVKYEEESGKPKDIYVNLNDSLKYHFYVWQFNTAGDTLFGQGSKISDDIEQPFKGNIQVENIESVQWEESNTTLSVLFVIGVLTTLAIALLIAALAGGGGGKDWM